MNIGIIAEDYCDVDVIYELTGKLIDNHLFALKKFVSHGSGKLRRKCRVWAENLLRRGCMHLIVVHDLDTFVEQELRLELESYIKNIGFDGYIVLIPIYEIEAWLLSDAHALRKVFSMRKIPKLPANPEYVRRPKEKIKKIVWHHTKKHYINTIHNQKIAQRLAITKLNKKCCSFRLYPHFISSIFSQRKS